jgi:hypothetical protein
MLWNDNNIIGAIRKRLDNNEVVIEDEDGIGEIILSIPGLLPLI